MSIQHLGNPFCETCNKDPTAHSFYKTHEINGITVFYTCPAKATKYMDREGILAHVDAVLANHNGKPWKWVFDSEGFGMAHALEMQMAIALGKLLTDKYGDNLQQIEIINPTWHIHMTLYMIWPFLNAELASMIVISETNADEESESINW